MTLYERTSEAFVKYNVQFVIIGGFAVNFWGYNRSTGDMDFFINPDLTNLSKLFSALDSLGFIIDSEAEMAIKNGELIQFSDNHHVVELLFQINSQKSFSEILEASKKSLFGEVEIPFIDFDDLIMEKLKSHRDKDLNDVHELKRIHGT